MTRPPECSSTNWEVTFGIGNLPCHSERRRILWRVWASWVWQKIHSVIFTGAWIRQRTPEMFKQCQTWEGKDARHLSQQRVSSVTPEQILLSLPPTDPGFFSPQSLYIHQAKYVFIPKCLQTGSVCLPQSLSVCVLCILFVDSAAAPHPSCIHTSRTESFSPLGLLRDRFNCGGIFTKPSKQPHRNWQARQNCSHDTPRAHKHVAHKGSPRVWSREQTLVQTRCLNRHNPYTATVCVTGIHTLNKMPLHCAHTGALQRFYAFICAVLPTATKTLFAFSNFTEKVKDSFGLFFFPCNFFTGQLDCCERLLWINCLPPTSFNQQ